MARISRDYPDDWDARRKKVYKRDDYTCCNCQERGGPHGDRELHAHHIVPKSKGGVDAMSNLITACKACHDAIHTRKLAPTVRGIGRSGSGPSLLDRLRAGFAGTPARVAIHLVLLVTTFGVGNVLYYLHGQRGGE